MGELIHVLFSVTFRKTLAESGTRVYYLNCDSWVFEKNCENVLKWIKDYLYNHRQQVVIGQSILALKQFQLVCLRGPFLVRYSFWCISMIQLNI